MLILEENFKWHLEAFASELFILITLYFTVSLLHITCTYYSNNSIL